MSLFTARVKKSAKILCRNVGNSSEILEDLKRSFVVKESVTTCADIVTIVLGKNAINKFVFLPTFQFFI